MSSYFVKYDGKHDDCYLESDSEARNLGLDPMIPNSCNVCQRVVMQEIIEEAVEPLSATIDKKVSLGGKKLRNVTQSISAQPEPLRDDVELKITNEQDE